jgi:integrase
MAKRSNGEGTIYHRAGGSWQARVTISGRRLSHTADSKKECQDWLKKTIAQIDQGLTLDGAHTTLSEFLDVWLELKAGKLRGATLELYKFMTARYLKPGLGKVILKDLTAAKIQDLYSGLLQAGKGRRTIEVTHRVLYGCLEHAHRLGLITQNWTARVEVPRPEKREMSVWSESQVSQFLTGCDDPTFYRLVFATGMRRAELCGLKWEDLDFQSGTIKVRRQVFEPSGGGYRLQEPKTERGRRVVRLGPGLLEALRVQYNQVLPQARAIAGGRWQEHDLIFPSSIGTPRHGDNVGHLFRDLVKKSGLPHIRFHDIRHTAASIMLLHGEPPVRVAGILGQSVAVLLDTYAHWIPDDQATASALMDLVTSPVSIEIKAGWRRVGAEVEKSSK